MKEGCGARRAYRRARLRLVAKEATSPAPRAARTSRRPRYGRAHHPRLARDQRRLDERYLALRSARRNRYTSLPRRPGSRRASGERLVSRPPGPFLRCGAAYRAGRSGLDRVSCQFRRRRANSAVSGGHCTRVALAASGARHKIPPSALAEISDQSHVGLGGTVLDRLSRWRLTWVPRLD